MDHSQPYETLDPENWDDMRALAHHMVDDALTYLQTVRERPVWQPVPEEVADCFKAEAPHEPWAISIRAFGHGIWAMGRSPVPWPIFWHPS